MSSNSPSAGDPLADAALAAALGSIRVLASDRFEILGPLGQDREGEFAFLAREGLADFLVVLKLRRSGNTRAPAELQVVKRLDSSVPPPAGSCPVCQTPFSGWEPSCPDCGSDLAGPAGTPGASRQELLAAVQQAASGYQVLGEMPRSSGGANVYFARESEGGTIVALRLEQEDAPGRPAGYTVAATRMMRPKLLYGTVGGEPRESGGPPRTGRPPWTPAPSPQARPGGSGAGSPSGPSSFTESPTGERVCPQCGETFGPELRFCPKDGSGLRARAPSEDLIGQVIAERYHVLSKLGEGGMGRVYLAEHVRMGRQCALKVMNPMLLYDPDSVSRFNREAANASRITHPNVAAIYDFGETDELVYLAMEFVEGESLAALLERECGLPARRAIEIGRQVADGLSAAHDLGIVHRDLKPDNVMVTRSRAGRDVVKVVDFGIAKATRGGRQTVTRTGYVVGTPAYMSPEQILGDALDARSDIYSLGCILYEILTGERAFADASGEVSIRQRLTEPPPPPRRVNQRLSKKLDSLVTTAMARAPEQRFQSAAQLSEALVAAGAESPATRSWRNRLPWGRSRESADAPGPATTVPRGSSPPPFDPALQPGLTEPVPLGWTGAVQPQIQQPGRGTTVLRHRSARPPSRSGWLIAGGCAAVLLVALGVWRLLSGAPQPELENQIVVPGPVTPPSPAEPVAGDSAPPAAQPSPEVPAQGTVWFADALPLGARITVDGEEVSVPPDGRLSLAPGSHTFVVEASGFRPARQSARVAAGEVDTLRIRMTEEPVAFDPPADRGPAPAPKPPAPKPPVRSSTSGLILVIGDPLPGAEMSLDGRSIPAGEREIPAPPGLHWLKLSVIGYRPDSSQIEVRPGAESRWELPRLTALPRPEPLAIVAIATPDTTIPIGGSVRLRVGVTDEAGGTLDKPVQWESLNPEVATVERGGLVKGVGEGRAYIRAASKNTSDSIEVTVELPPPSTAGAPRPAAAAGAAVPAIPSAADIQAAVVACTAAFGSGNERQIVETYQAKTAQDVTNLRKVLDVALKAEAKLEASELKRGAPVARGRLAMEVPLELRFNWRNNAGVNKKKEAPFRLELSKTSAGWKLASCRASEKLGF